MQWSEWFALGTLVIAFGAMVRDRVSSSGAMVGATIALLCAQIITPRQALAGFANPAPITIAALYVLAAAVERTGALSPLVRAMLGSGRSLRPSLARLLFPTAAMSAFLNNTPIVALLVPEVQQWTTRNERPASMFLMPLSFAAILGGIATIAGTATHLLVSGMMQDAGLDPFGFFELSRTGVPIAVAGLLLIIVVGPIVLPERRSTRREVVEELRDYVVDMVVSAGQELEGHTVEAAGLRRLNGVFLVELQRAADGHHIAPVRPDTILHGGDRLRFAGKVDDIVDLQRLPGLVSAEKDHVVTLETDEVEHFEAVVGAASPLVGKTLKEAGFRSRYQAAVLAIHRAGHRISGKLGQVTIRTGDTLLMVAGEGFYRRWRDRPDFLLIAPFFTVPRQLSRRAWLVFVVAVAIVALSAARVVPLVTAALGGAAVLVFGRALGASDLQQAIDTNVVVTIAAAFGLAAGVNNSGLATRLSTALVQSLGRFGPRGVLLGVALAAALLKELVTNNAAAALVLPIALTAARTLSLQPRGIAAAVTLACATSFLTPTGYATNIMVYGPGGYTFADYLRLGLPLTALVIAGLVWLVPLGWPI